MRKIILFCICVSLPALLYAQSVIHLKSGQAVEGTIVERTNEYIKVDTMGVALTYWMDEVDSIEEESAAAEGSKPEKKTRTLKKETTRHPEAVRELKKVIKGYLIGFSTGNADMALDYVSPDYTSTNAKTGQTLDYPMFVERIKKAIAGFPLAYEDISLADMRIIDIKLEGETALTELQYVFKVYDPKREIGVNLYRQAAARFVKEAGQWKIAGWNITKRANDDIHAE